MRIALQLQLIWLLFGTALADVSVVSGSATNNTQSYTAASGSDRVVAWAETGVLGSALIDFQSATFGAVSMTERADGRRTSGSAGRSMAIADVLQASIPGGSNTLTATWDQAVSTNKGYAVTLAGVNQTSPIRDADSAEGGGVSSLAIPSMTVQAGDMVLWACNIASTTITVPAGYTTLMNAGSPVTAVGYKAITSTGTEAPSASFDSSTQAVCAAVVYATAVSGVAAAIARRREMGE